MVDNLEREFNFLTNKNFQREFIVDNFQLLAAIGWHSYLSDGRGFLLVSSFRGATKCPHWLIPSATIDFIALYVGEKTQAFPALFGGDWREVNQVITSYNPCEISLVAFHNRRINQFSIFFVSSSEITPINSYQVLASRLREFFGIL